MESTYHGNNKPRTYKARNSRKFRSQLKSSCHGLGNEVCSDSILEKQSDWYGKRGLSWRVISMMSRDELTGELQVPLFAHLLD